MSKEELIKFNNFRQLCLVNSEDAIRIAEELQNRSVNHIVFQLVVFGLEEIGKIFLGWYHLNSKEDWGKEHYNIPIDDHIKKLFWAIWGPSFANEKITKKQLEEIQEMASNLHNKRLDVMYTDLSDTIPSSAKIKDEELDVYVKLARARLELSKLEGEVDIDLSDEKQEDIRWFMETTDMPEKRNFIFGNQSQEKLIEFGEVQSWILWLKEHFEREETELKEILKKELEKSIKQDDGFEPKWKIRFKVNSPSHSIRANILNKFSSKSPLIKFYKGADNHTLLIDIILDKKIPIKELWHRGWTTSNLLVTALNIGTNGLFYWNLPIDIDKYYDQIWDIENKRQLEAKLQTSVQLDWSAKKMYLREEELALTFLVFRYFAGNLGGKEFEPITHFMTALGMLAKNDMHLRLEPQCFLNFFLAFKNAIVINENLKADFDIKDVGFKLIEKLIPDRTEFDKVMDIGIQLEVNNGKITIPFSLTEIIGIKQYSGLYFVTLAARKLYGDNSLLLTKQE